MNSIRDFLAGFFLERQIILRPLGNTVYVLPPYCTTNEQLEQVYSAIVALLEVLEKRAAVE
jgi:adenosylmethionine-8-amino-7-oxononanoate aminotransferase